MSLPSLFVGGGDSEGLELPMTYDFYLCLYFMGGGSDRMSYKRALCLWGHRVIDIRVSTTHCFINSLNLKKLQAPLTTVPQGYYTV